MMFSKQLCAKCMYKLQRSTPRGINCCDVFIRGDEKGMSLMTEAGYGGVVKLLVVGRRVPNVNLTINIQQFRKYSYRSSISD